MRLTLPEVLLAGLALGFGLLGFGLPGFGTGGYELTTRSPDGLRVVTWNVGGTDGGGHALRSENVYAVLETLREIDADLVFLQELTDRSQLVAIANLWDDDATIASSQGGGSSGAIARRGTLIPWNIERPGRRPALSVTYQPQSGQTVHAVALHASPFSSKRRNREIGRAVGLLEDEPLAAARLLCGDLNLDFDPGGRSDLFTDDEHLDIETYNYIASRMTDAGLHAGPTAEPDRRLDYVFYRAEALEFVDGGPLHGHRAGDMDHRPLVCDFVYR